MKNEIIITCAKCNNSFKVESAIVGKKGRCSVCKNIWLAVAKHEKIKEEIKKPERIIPKDEAKPNQLENKIQHEFVPEPIYSSKNNKPKMGNSSIFDDSNLLEEEKKGNKLAIFFLILVVGNIVFWSLYWWNFVK